MGVRNKSQLHPQLQIWLAVGLLVAHSAIFSVIDISTLVYYILAVFQTYSLYKLDSLSENWKALAFALGLPVKT